MAEKSSQYISRTSKEYAIYVAENRAIPMISDGLKSGQRKMLWLMRNKSDKIKTVSLAGLSIQEGLYLHGDGPAAESISALAGPYVNNIPLFEGIGTFGTKISPNAFGAPRYTYVKRNKAAQELLYKDLEIVPLKDNYDGSAKEPVHFLPIIPLVLLNGISGIAVGYSTEILPHNLTALIDSCLNVLNGKKLKKLVPEYSSFSLDIENIEDSSWMVKGKIDIVDDSTIRVLELPPDLSLEKFKKRLDDLEDNGIIKSYIDKSTDHISLTIKFRRGHIKGWDKEKIIDFLKIKSRVTERIVVLDWTGKSIKQYDNPESVVKDFVEWRLTWYKKRYEWMLEQAQIQLPYYEYLKECFDKKFPEIVIKLKNKEEIENWLHQNIKNKNDHSNDVMNIAIYKWTREHYSDVLKSIKDLKDKIKEYKAIIADGNKIKQIYIDELMDLKTIKF